MAKKENKQRSRAAAMKLIYEWSMGGDGGEDTLRMIYEADGVTPAAGDAEAPINDPMAELLARGVIENADSLDEIINARSVGWKTDRMPKVDLAILRLGLYELGQKKEPVPVIINEAVELANIYCGEKSGSFINGVLGAYSREAQAQ